MTTRPANDLLYDSEASFRLVDNAIGDFSADAQSLKQAAANLPHGSGGLSTLPQTLLRAYSEITGILDRLRESRGVMEQAAVDRLTQMNDKLKEVSSATEVAATDILNGLDRSVAMVDELDAIADKPESATRGAEIRSQMRDELFGLMVHLQFQDITTQQLAFASSIIREIEQRLGQIVGVFEPNALVTDAYVASTPGASGPVCFDPNATTANAADRQTMADEIFLVNR
jgi:hypothetical protein